MTKSKLSALNQNNLDVMSDFEKDSILFDFVYADMIYDNTDFFWITKVFPLVKKDGVFIIQTDFHTCSEVKLFCEGIGFQLINWCIYVNDWGGVPKKGFPRKHDDILIFSKTKNFKWYPDRIQIPKATAGTAFDKKGTGLKTPPDVFYDKVSFSTVAKERVKQDGKNIQWQKPKWLMERLLLPFTDEGDTVLDLFMGSGTLGEVCSQTGRHYVGIENDIDVFNLAIKRIF